MPLPHFTPITCVELAETECPCQEDEESAEKEQVVCSSARRRLNSRRHSDFRRSHELDNRHYQISSSFDGPSAIVGHLLANGLRAPLLN